ncbi:M12 family metallo-peptidase [Microbacterium sp. 77mftsu3.1]|uniref:M12 family metallo-peptidase n=1 Tax=Microbacterium sp. 77mftsu3.1 TaxID=1761802 RepID=UPI00037B40BB|nr:M12 family metallo-peptidase [Microbacterium sp. 77mftsu3.1]SDH54161.1 Metallo-peptidase family M12 [Microbacterium sp. 77mftsu3.1]
MIIPARSRVLAILTATAIVVLGLPVSAASAAEPAIPGVVALEGVIRVLPDEEGMASPEGTHATENTVTLVTEEGTTVELTGTKVGTAETGAAFTGTVTVAPKVAALVEPVPAEDLGEQVAQAAAELDVPLKVTSATLAPPTAAAAAPKAHTVDVMVFQDSSRPAGYGSDSDVDKAVGRLSEYWTSESGGQVSTIRRANAVKRDSVPESLLCDANALWDYASGPKGFSRDYYGNTSMASAHYWAKGNGDHLLVLVPGDICGEGNGLGTVGSVHAGGVAWASVSTVATDWDQVVFHELGHNLGLGHSNLTQCSLPTVEGDSCTQQEYYDFYDVMGGGIWWGNTSNFANIGSLNSSQKVNLDALTRTGTTPGIQTVTAAGGASQAFTLRGMGTGTGLRALDVVNQHTGEHYYVEYRSGTGRDALAFYGRVGKTERTWAPGVRILELDCENPTVSLCSGAASTVLRNAQTGALSFQSGQQFESLTTGQDTPGLRVKVDAASTTSQTAAVTVTFDGAATAPTELTKPVITGTAKVGETLTATVDAGWADQDYELRWVVGGVDVEHIEPTYTVRPDDAGKTIEVWGVVEGGDRGIFKSAPTGLVAKGTLPAFTLRVTGTPIVGGQLVADGVTSPQDAEVRYRWMTDGTTILGATGRQYSPQPADFGKRVSVQVTVTLAGYNDRVVTSPASPAIANAEIEAGTPSIYGIPTVGRILTADPGYWSEGTFFTYQWNANGTPIAGATGPSYTVGATAAGKPVTVTVTGSNPGFTTATRTSAATAAVDKGWLTSVQPVIRGTAKVGNTLTVTPGVWAERPALTVQWLVDGRPVTGATRSSFTLEPKHARSVVTVDVTGSLAGYYTHSRTASAGVVALGTLAASTPAATGSAKVGSKLTAKPGTWSAGTRFAYQWYANGSAISRATGSTFTPTTSQLGKAITVKVTGTKAGYSTVSKVSKATGEVAKGTLSVAAPKISGTGKVGAKHTATLTTKVSGAKVTYQWYSNGRTIKGATKPTYVATRADRGKSLTVKVTYAKSGYVTVAKTSAKKAIR